MVVVLTALVVLFAVKLGIDVFPLGTNPIFGFGLFQVNWVAFPRRTILGLVSPLHNVTFAGAIAVGSGLTVIRRVSGIPLQTSEPVLSCGMTLIEPKIGLSEAFCALNELIFPVPEAAKPILGLLLVQLNVFAEPLKLTPPKLL